MTKLVTAGCLRFEVAFERPEPEGTAATATRGWVGVSIVDVDGRETVVWPFGGSGTPSWPWVELLEHLASSWPYLLLESGGDPLALGVDPDALADRASTSWATRRVSEVVREREDHALRLYLRRHNLAAAFRGADAPPIYVIRIGERARVVAANTRIWCTWTDVEQGLSRLGDAVASRLSTLRDGRAEDAKTRWENRAKIDRLTAFEVAIAWPREKAKGLLPLVSHQDLGDLAAHPVAIAARMLAPGTASEVEPLLRRLGEAKPRPAVGLDALRDAAQSIVPVGEPYEAGSRLAIWLRGQFQKSSVPVSIRDLLSELDVEVIEASGTSSVDALCAYGPKHGPVIVLNTSGLHAKGHRGRRATLAHELCHLLVDLRITLPLAEAKAPRAPLWIEQRANAFAAELLMPKAVAAATLSKCKTAAEAKTSVSELCSTYDASTAIVAWQALNSDIELKRVVRRTLEPMAPRGAPLSSWKA